MRMNESEPAVIIEATIRVSVELPETQNGVEIGNGEGEPTTEALTRAIDAFLSAMPSEHVQVFIDGEDKPPADVYFDCSDEDVEDVTVE